MQSRSWILSVVGLLCGSSLAVAQAPTPMPVDSNVAVSAFARSRGQDLQGNPCTSEGATGCGGCYPEGIPPPNDQIAALLGQLNLVDPEWQPIGPMLPGGDASLPPAAVPVLVTGTVRLSKSPGDDFPATHITPDYNAEIIPDDNGKLATGNGDGKVEFEWEGDKLPAFAWPGEGDRILALGRWIFDCGHADPGPQGKCSNDANKVCNIDSDCSSGGTCSNPSTVFNYQSELHPPQAVAVIRSKSVKTVPATRADVFISADAGGASDRCTVTHLASPLDVLNTKACLLNHCSKTTNRTCTADSQCAKGGTCIRFDPAKRLADINAANFEFDLPLPPQPAGATKVKVTSTTPPNANTKALTAILSAAPIMPKATFVPNLAAPTPVVHVVVPMTVAQKKGMPNVFAQSITAKWVGDKKKLTHVQVKFTGVTINNPVKDGVPAIHAAGDVTRGLCTNPTGGLSSTACGVDSDCPTGLCAGNGKKCNTNSNCPSTDFCQNGSRCVGGPMPGWRVWGEVNGDWAEFPGFSTLGKATPFGAPPYVQPGSAFTINQKLKFDEYLPSDGSLHIKVTGRSLNCENVTLFGKNLKENLFELGLDAGAACLIAISRDPGTVDKTYSGPTFGTDGSGSKTFDVDSDGGDAGTCSTTSTRLCIADADCPTGETCNVTGGAFTLHYSIAVL